MSDIENDSGGSDSGSSSFEESSMGYPESDDDVRDHNQNAWLNVPGDPVGIRAAQDVMRLVTQSNLSAFHSAGVGSAISGLSSYARIRSPALRTILDLIKQEWNCSMILHSTKKGQQGQESLVAYKSHMLGCYLKDLVTNFSSNMPFVRQEDTWRSLQTKLGRSPGTEDVVEHNLERPIICFHINWSQLSKYGLSLKQVASAIDYPRFVSISVSPDFVGLIDVELKLPGYMPECLAMMDKHISGSKHIKDYQTSKMKDDWIATTIGSDLLRSFECPFFDHAKTTSNNILDVERTLGIEAARRIIRSEIVNATKRYKDAILIADFMTMSGKADSFTKASVALKQRGFLTPMAFEKPRDDIRQAVLKGSKDDLSSTYARIIMGLTPHCGTGSVSVREAKRRE